MENYDILTNKCNSLIKTNAFLDQQISSALLKSDELSDEISFLKSELQKALVREQQRIHYFEVREQQRIHYFEVREQELLQRIQDLEAKNKMWWPW